MRTPPAGVAPARTQIGPYHVVGWLGAGGMGQVYRARDPRLERDVAIKLLKPETAGDLVRQSRLLAEGRAASALNHPNILTVYDADLDGDSYYLVTELIDGHPLRQELARGPLQVRRLLDVATQVAEGLAAAHAAGIVHRDLKPENVMIARDGRAKIVDFGLAVPAEEPIGLAPGGTTTTVNVENIRGTPAYMSPEQARGKGADYRSDQFSFGALVYEMSTGTSPFRRETVAETLTAIVNEEPAPIASLNARVPALLRWITERCLAKEPENRYSATDDLAREIRWLRDRLSELTEVKPADDVGLRLRIGRVALPAVAVAIAAIAAAALVARPGGAHLGSYRFTPIAAGEGYEGMPVWSPDGQTLAYVGDVNGVLQIFTRRLHAALSNQVTFGSFDASEPLWAPDGQRLYFISLAGEGSALFSVGAAGGRPELVLENVMHAAIDPAGKLLAVLREDTGIQTQRLWWAASDGTALRREARPPLDAPDGFGQSGFLRFRPDGREMLLWTFMSAREASPERPSRFYLVPIDGGSPREILPAVAGMSNLTSFDWLPDNRRIVVSIPDARASRHLWIADTRTGSVQPVTATHTNETFPAVSPDGHRVAYASEDVDFDLILITPDGRSQRSLLATTRNEMDPVWAPAGDQMAFVTDRTGDIEIWLRSRDGRWERPLVTQEDFGSAETRTLGALAFSPDGRTLAYQRSSQGKYQIWLSPVGGGPPVQLIDGDIFQGGPSWSLDGAWLTYASYTRGVFAVNKIRIGEKKPVVLYEQSYEYPRSAWSPDGRWILCKSSGGLVRIPADGGEAEPVVQGIVYEFTWAPDSRSAFVLQDSEMPGHVALAKVDTFTGEQTTLNADLGPVPIANQPIRGLSLLPGVGFLTSFASARSDIWLLEGFASSSRSWVDRWLFP